VHQPTAPDVIRSYRDLRVWQGAIELVDDIYRLTRTFSADERYGLVSQLRRAAISVASNIAEGHTRSRADYRRFLEIAAGSLTEVETQLHISMRLGFIDTSVADPVLERCGQLGRMLTTLRKRLIVRNRNPQPPIPSPP
jgi:four helix bundle protein